MNDLHGLVERLGRFGHHPEPAIDFCVEVESLESIVHDKEIGLRSDEPLPVERYHKALDFRVGGDEQAVNAKHALRQLAPRIDALSTPSPEKAEIERKARELCAANFASKGSEGEFGSVDDCWFAFVGEARAAHALNTSQGEG